MKAVLLWMIRFYRRFLSPLRPPCCRFIPTCSAYALEAVEKYGALKGGFLALRRILRCNPWGGSGYDPYRKNRLLKSRKNASSILFLFIFIEPIQ